jgi:hypothetical protein
MSRRRSLDLLLLVSLVSLVSLAAPAAGGAPRHGRRVVE